MAELAPHSTPCARCHAPHPARIAGDGGRTYRHADGHAWTPPTDEPAPAVVRLTTPAEVAHPDFHNALFGVLSECRECAAMVENRDSARQQHRAWHAQWTRRPGGAA